MSELKAFLAVKLDGQREERLYLNKVPANFVPAAAVKRGGQALLVMTGCKGFVGGTSCYIIKYKFYLLPNMIRW